MLMINLMQPKYYFPVKGEYKEQYRNAEIATKCGISRENIILKLNGDVISFTNGIMDECFDHVETDEILIIYNMYLKNSKCILQEITINDLLITIDGEKGESLPSTIEFINKGIKVFSV